MNIEKFKFQEIFQNQDGKTSASGYAGVLIILIGTIILSIVLTGMFKEVENIDKLLPYTITYIGYGVGLLGVRKIKN